MAQYRKKPVIIEAFRYGIDDRPEWFKEAGRGLTEEDFPPYGDKERWCDIYTLEGVMTVYRGYWIIRGVQGEIYSCDPDVFALNYEPVEEG